MNNIKLFENKQVGTHWDEKEQQWYFSVIDVVEILTDSQRMMGQETRLTLNRA